MMRYPMVDLLGQYQKIKTEIDAAIREVLKSGSFIKGPAVKSFQEKLARYLDVKHVVSCGNGTDALQLALMALDLKPGDEIITTPFTFISTVEVIALLNLTPVFVDVLPDTFNIDPDAVEKAITPKTKAVIPVHLFGQAADMLRLKTIVEKHKLFIIEDTAQALGADISFPGNGTKKAGTVGDIGCTSFFPSKNLGAFGDGGAVFTDNDELATKIQGLANHGMNVRYHYDYVGVNSRLDSIQAAILGVKLKYLNDYAASRQEAATFYNNAFKNCKKIHTPAIASFTTHVFHQYTLVLKDIDREGLMRHLAEKGIASAVYYPVPLHLQQGYQFLDYKEGDFPVTETLCKSVLSLPIHTELTVLIQQEIADAVLEFVQKH